ncbi:MAG: type II toxin-antitoxin system RelE/ParE family toxin [Sporomusaceae bacterium]|nr:type II toxin-antitoxin system RelE/ParE family toxin [Sporomusaceae bacterium]
MQGFKFEVQFYAKVNGTEPAKEFLESLDTKMFAKIIRVIDILRTAGTMVREPYSKHLDDGIFEIRAQSGTDISRVLYFFVVGCRIVLTHGFSKKTPKTPAKEIALAKKYRDEYLSKKEDQQ